jgi:hypothetical protein
MSRKKIIINWDKLDSYLQLKASRKACACLIGVSEDSIDRYVKKKTGMTFGDYAKSKMEPVKLKLVQKALSMALSGNVVMMIFCLKNIAGWTDSPDIEIEQQEIDATFELVSKK